MSAAMRYPQRQPPLWFCLGLPVLMLMCTVAIYQHGQSAAEASAEADLIDGKFAGDTSYTQGSGGGGEGPMKMKHPGPGPGPGPGPAVERPATVIREGNHDEYLAVCLYVRNQAQDLPEFFQHHYYEMGIRRFYVMDDRSEPPMSHYMDRYGIPEEAMEFIHFDTTTDKSQGTQTEMDNACAHTYGVNNTWIAFINADEFLDTPGDETLEDILRNLEATQPDAGALGINWAVHTSSHQLTHVESVRKTYLECVWDDPDHDGEGSESKYFKSIVRQDAYENPMNPHKFNLKPGFVTVGELGDEITHYAFRQPITRDRIAVHQYALKSFEDYADKITRNANKWEFWNLIEYQLPHQACAEMLKYFPATLNRDGYW
ncbi:unnamed protein product [Discula destructiva]